jgi:DNA-binding NtrC family response regulator
MGMVRDAEPTRVLVVDDEALIRWAVSETLTQAGYDVVEAADAQSALRVLSGALGPVDVVLLDLRLPDSSDLTLLSKIRALSPKSAVVMMSAHASAEIAAQARTLGAFDILPKPFDLEGCEHVLRQACGAVGH